ncbi:dCTP deaminase domain-containing protein [Massilia oculi]|uniref:dCTP deaminase domain-containing protein n=1 Tax=Massilia oculi TaxID=945844 RepID=UPI0028AEDC06|nr:hypothetical protein [Massilia oculi]
MSFWSGDKLKQELPNLVVPHDYALVDCASIRLRLGDQAFVTHDQFVDPGPTTQLIQTLNGSSAGSTIVIPPGQFAFLLTEETIKVPINALALISMRASYKFKGLINVSGFHVDPGFHGKLLFGVYNAGPSPIILQKLQELFLIVYADLDRPSSDKYRYKGAANNRAGINPDLIQGMTGQVFSPMLLRRKMDEIDTVQRSILNDLADIKGRGRTWDTLSLAFAGLILAVVIAVFASDFVKAAIGGWIKSSTDLYLESIKKDQKDPSAEAVKDKGTSSIIVNVSESTKSSKE